MHPEAESSAESTPGQASGGGAWRKLWSAFSRREASRASHSADGRPAVPQTRARRRPAVEIGGWAAFDWLVPWAAIDKAASAELTGELRRELCHGHALFGQDLIAVGRRMDCADVLFRWRDGSQSAAIVHLTYDAECDAKWPAFEVLSTRDAFLLHMAVDHGGFEDDD